MAVIIVGTDNLCDKLEISFCKSFNCSSNCSLLDFVAFIVAEIVPEELDVIVHHFNPKALNNKMNEGHFLPFLYNRFIAKESQVE